MTRGEIWWVDFGLAFGSMAMGRRPALIVQNDNFNVSNIATTVVLPLTTKAYGFDAKMSESEIVAELFKIYEKLTEEAK